MDLVQSTTRLPDTSNTNTTRATQVQHERNTTDRSVTQVKSLDFDNGTSENIFTQPYVANNHYKERKNIILKTTIWKCPVPILKKNAPEKLNVVMAKVILKTYELSYSCKSFCTFPHSYA